MNGNGKLIYGLAGAALLGWISWLSVQVVSLEKVTARAAIERAIDARLDRLDREVGSIEAVVKSQNIISPGNPAYIHTESR